MRVELLDRVRLVELPGDLRQLAASSFVHAQSKLRRARMRRLRNSGRLRRHLLLYPDRTGSLGMRQLACGRVLVRWHVLLRMRDLSARGTRRCELFGKLREHELHVPMRLDP